jgi:AcrR family transcriptional regulator
VLVPDRAQPSRTSSAAPGALQAAGLALFAELGFEGASTHAIAERAGLPQGLVRYHFGSKEGLWREVIAEGVTALATTLETAAQLGEPGRALPQVADAHRDFIQVVCHALLEHGARRDWLIAELCARLRPYAPALRVRAAGGAARSQDDDVIAWMWLGAAVAMSAFAPALEHARGAALDRERVLRVQRAAFAAWSASAGPLAAAGPWSLAAAAHRRRSDHDAD